MRARSRFLVLTWVGACALVSSALTACSSDDSTTPAPLDGSADSSTLAPPLGVEDSEAPESGGLDSTVADVTAGDSTAADGPTEATGTDGGDSAVADGEAGPMSEELVPNGDGGPDAGREAGTGEAGSEGGILDAGTEGGTTNDGGLPDGGDAGLTSEGVIANLRNDTCRQCAITNDCLDPGNGMPTCETTTGVSAPGTPDPGVTRSTLCFSTLECLLQTNCFKDDSVLGCYCGTVAGGSCSTTNANGPCKTQEEDGFESTDLNVILGTPGNTDTGSDVANEIVECLYFDCNAECSFADAGP
jgi:hypothetical protein